MKRRAAFAILVACSWSSASFAADTESANALIRQGADLFKHEDYEGARAAFSRAYDLDPKAPTLFNLALSELNSNHPVEAAAHFREYLAHTEEPEAKLDSVRTKWLPRASGRTALLYVFARPGAQIAVDGVVQRNVPPPPGTPGNPIASIVIAAGDHEVSATQATMVETQHVVARGGELVEAHFQRVPNVSAVPQAAGQNVLPSPPQSESRAGTSQAKWITVIALGSGAIVAAALGLDFALMSQGKLSQTRRLMDELDGGSTWKGSECNGVATENCAQLNSDVEAIRQYWWISNAAYVSAGVLLLGAAATWTLWPTNKAKTSAAFLRPALSAHRAGFELGTQW
jgi:tetratricopeptide repeat protein